MRPWMYALLIVSPGCDAWNNVFNPNAEADTDTDTDADADADADTDADSDADADPVVDPDPPQAGVWDVRPHPCVGARTDTMLVEDNGATVWIGCGTTVDGTGLYRSVNAGNSWEEVAANVLDTWRINDIHRSSDGNLYLAGVDVNGDGRGAMLDSSFNVTELLVNEGQLWNAMVTGSVRRTPNGDIAFESLNGTDVAYRGADDPLFYDAYGWWTNGIGKQILDLEILGDDFFGVGSTIASPPVVFLPPLAAREGFQMYQLELSEDFEGELWDLHIDGGGLVAAGANQDDNRGVVFFNRGNPYQLENWRLFDAGLLEPSLTTWFRAVCRVDSRIVASGEYSTTGDGFMVASEDNGASWYRVTLPADTGPVTVCHGMPDGTFRFAGGDGFYASYTF